MKKQILFIATMIILGSSCVKNSQISQLFTTCYLDDLKSAQDIDDHYDEARANYFENVIDSDPSGCKLYAIHRNHKYLYTTLIYKINNLNECNMRTTEKKLLLNRLDDNIADIDFQIEQLDLAENCEEIE
ncbi:hypothetical protein ACE1ET_01300 [Saccharicrinis sp. FJH62]|uniref:hypothetical protein n=1 Tax=Saccharicrinis sp. FJH62 TaxID=3344657 RepID=UPI0035D5168D